MKFLVQSFVSLVVAAALWVGLNLLRLGEMLPGPTGYTCQLADWKRELASRTATPKVVPIGASNVLVGIRADEIAARTGVPAVNLGLTMNLGADVIFAVARSSLQPGDIAVLALEYQLFEDKDYSGPLIREALFYCDTDAIYHLPLRDQVKAFLLQPVSDVAKGTLRRAARWLRLPLPFEHDYNWPQDPKINSVGDTISNAAANVKPEFLELLRNGQAAAAVSLEFSERSEGARVVRDFVKWARDHGVLVLANWPNAYWPRKDLAADGFRKMKEFYRSLDIPILGQPEDTLFAAESFYDSGYHLTAEAAIQRTVALIVLLEPYLKGKGATRAASPRQAPHPM